MDVWEVNKGVSAARCTYLLSSYSGWFAARWLPSAPYCIGCVLGGGMGVGGVHVCAHMYVQHVMHVERMYGHLTALLHFPLDSGWSTASFFLCIPFASLCLSGSNLSVG